MLRKRMKDEGYGGIEQGNFAAASFRSVAAWTMLDGTPTGDDS
jgi:hypothetical protein